jgi:LysM domain
MTVFRVRAAVLALGLTALAACSGGPTHPRAAPPPPGAVAVTPVEIEGALTLMMTGKQNDARQQLRRLLKRDPMSPGARLLSDSIERDPKDLLGPQSYAYTVRSGDDMLGVAQRLLGNRLKAYQLLRYNGLTAPVVLTAGQTLRIPGELPRVEPVRTAEPTRPAAARPRPVVAKPAPPAGSAVAPTANPGAARSARAAGLAALNGGDINRAVGLLRRASAFDPANPLIARDLARAQRIAATVRARR